MERRKHQFIHLGKFPKLLYGYLMQFGKKRRTLYPFADDENRELWLSFLKNLWKYKNDISDFRRRVNFLKENFKIEIMPKVFTKDKVVAYWYDDQNKMVILGDFFWWGPEGASVSKADKIQTLEHELMHTVQYFFEIGEKYRFSNFKKYGHDPLEVETLGNDLYKEVLKKIHDGHLLYLEDISRYVKKNENFEEFKQDDQKRIMKKIILSVLNDYKVTKNSHMLVPRSLSISMFGSEDILESILNELDMPKKDVDEDIVWYRKLKRQEHIEKLFKKNFVRTLIDFGLKPQAVIKRYHRYITGYEGPKKITATDIRNIINNLGKPEYNKIISPRAGEKLAKQRALLLKDLLKRKLDDRVKRIHRGTASDKVDAGVSHVDDVKGRYYDMKRYFQ